MKKSANQIIHLLFYAACLFIVISVCTMPISIEEKVIHSFAWIYLVLAYAYFFDENPPKLLRVELLYGAASEEYNKEYLDQLLGVSQHSLSLMRKIQFHEDYQIVNQSIEELHQQYAQLKRLAPPQQYSIRHQEILNDINGFLEGLSEGNYYLAYTRTN